MKKPQFAFLPFLLLGMTAMGLSARIISILFCQAPQINRLYWLLRLLPAIALMVGALVCHLLARQHSAGYLVSYFLNAAGSGCAVSVIFGARAYAPPPELLIVLLPAVLLGVLSVVLINISSKRFHAVIALVFSIAALILSIAGIFLLRTSVPAGLGLLFSGLYVLPFPICMAAALHSKDNPFRYLSFSGFGAFTLIILAAAVILSDGDILDELDFSDISGDFPRKKKGKKQP